jgi:hypothetical protein
MTARRRPRARAALAALLAVVLAALAGCASIPTSGEVQDGGADVPRTGEIGFIAAGPNVDDTPDEIVRGFLSATQAGPTTAQPFNVAREFLTSGASQAWEPYSRVLVLDGYPTLSTDEVETDASTATVRAKVTVVASVDERGVYTEEPRPSPNELTFELGRSGGQWRITGLDDGLLFSTAVFSQAYHLTRLYYPTPDLRQLVPDVRWFPRTTWRTNAVQEILAGPPEWLAGSVVSVVPEGTALAIEAVTVADDGTVAVNLTEQVDDAAPDDLALFAAQLEATLVTGQGEGRTVTLADRTGPLAVPEAAGPTLPRTEGDALALVDGQLRRVEGRELVPADEGVSLAGLDVTALASGPAHEPVVVRDGADRVVRLDPDGTQDTLLQGTDLLAPSVDRYGAVWSGVRGGALQVVVASGQAYPVSAAWLEDVTVTSVRVSPEGSRVALVTTGPDGTAVRVAGILRDAAGVPTGLSDPVPVGASVQGVTLAQWQDEATLALLGQDSGGERTVFLAGVGGLAGTGGGLSRSVPGVTTPTWVTAAVGSTSMLALDAESVLHIRQSSALWPAVASGVGLVAFPG